MMDPHTSTLKEDSPQKITAAGAYRGGTDIMVYSLLAAVFLFRLVYAHFLGIVPDEAYYWDWSRDLSWGYFDHPPMIAWLIFLSRNVFGESSLGVRAATIACALVASIISYLVAKKYISKPSSLLLWVILSNSVILFCVGSVLATPDIPLVLFWSLSLLLGYMKNKNDVSVRGTKKKMCEEILTLPVGIGLTCAQQRYGGRQSRLKCRAEYGEQTARHVGLSCHCVPSGLRRAV